MESGSSIKKTIKLELSGTDRMTAYNMSPVKISRLSGVQCDNIISYDARITNGTLTDLVRYVLDRQNHREMHQFLYYNVFGLPESISFSGLVQYSPELEGDSCRPDETETEVQPFLQRFTHCQYRLSGRKQIQGIGGHADFSGTAMV